MLSSPSPRERVGVRGASLILALLLSGCALITPRPAPDPVRLRIADLILIGFNGTQVVNVPCGGSVSM